MAKRELANPKEVISYAQNWEDLILHVLLYKVKKGFYVDVGANGPVVDSVTKYFYDRGWQGVNIEPSPTHIKELKQQRLRDTNLQVAAGNKQGSGEFREYLGGHHGLSTLSSAIKQEVANDDGTLPYRDYSVKVLPLREILKKHLKKGQSIDFLKIDVEGWEYEVIEGNDWQKYRPKIIVVESTHVKKDWRPLLKDANYKKVYFDGLNEYYASADYAPKVDLNIYPKVVTERGPVISWQQYLRREHLIQQSKAEATTKTITELIKKHDQEVIHKERSLRRSEASAKSRLDTLRWVFAHPLRFAMGRLYHVYIKRDQGQEYKE